MWNYIHTLPTAFIFLLFLIYFLSGSTLPVKRNRSFLLLVIMHGLTTLFDIWSSYLDNNFTQYSQIYLIIINLIFFVFYVARAYAFVNYLLSVPEQTDGIIRVRFFNLIFFVIFEVIVLLSIVTKWIFYIDDQGYHSGPYYNLLYFVFFAYILEMFIILVQYRKKFDKRELYSGFFFVSILMLGLYLRSIFPTLLVMNTFTLGAILIIFLTYQDIHLYEDQRVGLFNNRAFHQYVVEHIRSGKLYLYGYGIINYDDLRRMFGGVQMDAELKDITAQLRREYPKQVLFYLRNGRFMVASDKAFTHKEIKNGMMSIGTVEFPADLKIDNGQQLIEVARDVFSKFQGEVSKKNIVVDHEHLIEINHNIKVQQALNKAIYNDSIQVYLQPIYSVEKKRITGAEALARIEDPDMGMIQPYDFIPIAEKNGLIIKVGEAVFRKTCAFIKENHDERLQWVNVNLSPIQCVAEEPIIALLNISDEYGVSGERLKLEITEDAMVDDTELKRMMLKMSDHGFCFELDDFGVGFSNVLRLTNFPFSAVKIDRELVWQYHDNPGNSVLPHLIEDIRSSGMDVVAEGIESKSMGKEMIALGCNYLQGFYFSRPVPIKRFDKVFELRWEDINL
ncbi:MAG: EAL domain-containing protein [Lachnospiraceae bacterium]|nr:EAL domain-containing protein [Lachnospiraceae bacterium]